MIDYSCKVCGGNLHPHTNGLAVCDSCHTLQTISGITDADRAYLINRAIYMRRQGKFSQATSCIEKLLHADIHDAEAYWQSVLCRYGVSFEPNGEGTYKIDCHRLHQGNVLTDMDYKQALRLATHEAANQYKKDATMIASIQRECEAVMAQCPPWDVAIVCDESIQATREAAIQLYDQLKQHNFNVYLASKTATEHPTKSATSLAYAAVHTSWAMVVVISSQHEAENNLMSNLWKTYCSLDSKSHPRHLILAYQQIQLFNLPEDLISLEDIQNLNEHGAIFDLVYGIERYRPVSAVEPLNPLDKDVRQAYLHLSKGEFQLAQDYAMSVLQKNSAHAQALICIFLAKNKVISNDDTGLLQLDSPLYSYSDFKYLLNKITKESEKEHISTLVKEHNQIMYQKACNILAQENSSIDTLNYAANLFHYLMSFQDSTEKEKIAKKIIQEKEQQAKLAELEKRYQTLCTISHNNLNEYEIKKLSDAFRSLGAYRDSQAIADNLLQKQKEQKIEELNNELRRKRKKSKCWIKGILSTIILLAIYILLIDQVARRTPILINTLEAIHHILPLGVLLLPLLLVLIDLLTSYPATCFYYIDKTLAIGALLLVGAVRFFLQLSCYAVLEDTLVWLQPENSLLSLLLCIVVAIISFAESFGISYYLNTKY